MAAWPALGRLRGRDVTIGMGVMYGVGGVGAGRWRGLRRLERLTSVREPDQTLGVVTYDLPPDRPNPSPDSAWMMPDYARQSRSH